MKLLLIHCHYQQKGGEDTVVEEEMALLRSRGVEVELLSFNNEEKTLSKLLQLPYNLGAARTVRRKIRQFRPDLVHLHNLHFGASPSVIQAARKEGVKVVMTLHNYRPLCPSAILYHQGRLFLDSVDQSFPWTAVRKGVYKNSRLLTFWLALAAATHRGLGLWKGVDRFIVLNPTARELFLRSHFVREPKRMVIKPNFSPRPAGQPLPRQDHFFFAGRLCEEKGVDSLLEAFASSPYRLRIAGDGPLREKVIEAARLHPNIDYLGPLGRPEMIREMRLCTALVFPSVWLEGMPMTLIEAFACGTPVIASRLGAMKDMIQDGRNGLHFEAGKASSLRESLEAWQNMDQKSRESYYEQAQQTYENRYTPEQNAGLLIQLYQELLGVQPVLRTVAAGGIPVS